MYKNDNQDMTVVELSKILSKMYENANEKEKNTMVLLFGIKYSDNIINKGISYKEILKHTKLRDGSQLKKGWENEIRKGVKLSQYVIEK